MKTLITITILIIFMAGCTASIKPETKIVQERAYYKSILKELLDDPCVFIAIENHRGLTK